MAKLEVFQNGVFSTTGEPVFQVGSKNADGSYTVVVFDLMTKAEAGKRLNELQPAAPKKKAAVKPSKTPKTPKTPALSKAELSAMTKKELEIMMRNHGLELDRRKTKDTLVKQSVSFLQGK